MRATASQDQNGMMQFVAVKDAPLACTVVGAHCLTFVHTIWSFAGRLNFILGRAFTEPSLKVGVWPKPKAALDLVYNGFFSGCSSTKPTQASLETSPTNEW